MRFLGLDITRSKAPASGKGGGDISRPAAGQGPYTSLFKGFEARKVSPSLFEALREAIPVIDTAIHKMNVLDGRLMVDGKNKGLVHEIEDFMGGVQVNDLEQGLQAFLDNMGNETYEQGFAIGEEVFTPDRTGIDRLNVADSKDIRFRRTEKGIEIWYKGYSVNSRTRGATDQVNDILQGNLSTQELVSQLGSSGWAPLKRENVIYYSRHNENSNPYGTCVIRSMPFAAKILLTIENATLHVWERFGDPMYEITYKAGKGSLTPEVLETRRKAIYDKFKEVMDAKRAGKSADFVNAVDANSEMIVKVIGHDNQVLEIEAPSRHVLEQLIAASGLPAWMLGMHWSTTERLAKYEAEIMLQEAEVRGDKKLPMAKRVIETALRAKGRTWKRGDFELYFERPNLHDLVAQAQARFLNAQADYYEVQYGAKPTEEKPKPKPEPQKGGKSTPHPGPLPMRGEGACGCKERRPIPHAALEKVEGEYEAKLKARTAGLKDKVFMLLKLTEVKSAKGPADLPDPLAFALTEEQRSAVYKAMQDFIGEFDPGKDPEGVLKWYYGQSYSLGLIQAAEMLGKGQPVLDIIRNSEIFGALVDDGFALVKEGATVTLRDKIIAEMQSAVLAGTNPRHVADRLAGIFGEANRNWERLARSEMALAAEQAKLAEFEAEGATQIEFYAAADACPICIAAAGVYDIKEAPVPVRDTHPRCYCVLGPARRDL